VDSFCFDWVERHARFRPDATALVDLPSDRRFEYGALSDRIQRLAGILADAYSIEPGDRVAIAARNRADHFTVQFACWKLGAVFVPLNWRLSEAELKEIVAIAAPKVLITDTSIALASSNIHQLEFPDLQAGIDELVAGATPRVGAHISDDPNRTLTLLFTSGTTGKPKAVPYNETMIICSVLHAAVHAMVDRSTRTLLVAPLFHSAGLFAATTTAFHYGGSVAVDNKWDPEECLSRLSDKELQITHFNGVPTMFKQLAELPQFDEADLSHMRMLGIGSAPISRELLDRWSRKGVFLSQSYGLTEAFGVSITPAEDAEHFVGSAGLPMIHSTIRLVRDGQDAETGEVGEIWVRGPSVMPGYWQDSDGETNTFVDGWFPTGDLAKQDERGALFIVDRLKDMIISGGENIYPAEIEHVLATHPAVRSAAVIGAPHDHWGETPVAVIEARNGHSVVTEDLRRFCLERLARFKVPTLWFETPSFEHTAQGKLDKNELREEVLEKMLAGTERPGRGRIGRLKEMS
jgi:fatty-acyl-CoA synthase